MEIGSWDHVDRVECPHCGERHKISVNFDGPSLSLTVLLDRDGCDKWKQETAEELRSSFMAEVNQGSQGELI